MKTSSRRFVFIVCFLLLAVCRLCAKTDTLGYVGEKSRNDTTQSLSIFKKFTWNVVAKYRDGKTSKFVSARPDTMFKSGNLVNVQLSTDFFVDTQALNRILFLHYLVEGSVSLRLNGRIVLSTGIFQHSGSNKGLIQDEFTELIFTEAFGKMEITYLPYKTNEFKMRMAIYQLPAAREIILKKNNDDYQSYSIGFYYLAFGIVFLILFAFFKEKTENLYFSMFSIFAALSFLWQYLHTDLLYRLEPFFGVFCFEFLSIFFCKVLRNKEKSKIPLAIIGALMMFCFLLFIHYGWQDSFGRRAPWLIVAITGVLYCYVWVSTLYFLVRGIGQKRWEARAVLVICFVPIIIFLALILLFVFVVAVDFKKGINNEYFPMLIGYFGTSIVYIYPLAAVFILARRNGLNQRKLTAQVKSIQQLSEENLAKEKEKKDILEGQNESLEKEVVLRTVEIVAQKEKIEKQHEELKIEKRKSDDLLRNILPEEVADELKANGTTTARHYNNVTVLFTDFVDFTKAGEHMSPQALIDELHTCFKAFDEITGKYGIEKIKTIGDAYLAVCGLPAADPKHAENVVYAATEINTFMAYRLATLGSDRTFAIRIGIHSGSVVAGIVGVKKFAYDIWGDTVNTAARMEQHGEAGKINISQTTYDLVKDKIACAYRGEIQAKNKGVMKMYFASSAAASA